MGALQDDPRRSPGLQALESRHPDPGQEGRNNFKRGVLGGGSQEGQQARFHVGQKGVLLNLVEAVDLVHEEDRSVALPLQGQTGLLDDLADLLDPGQDGRKGGEFLFGFSGQEQGQGGLARARGAPEDEGGRLFPDPLRVQEFAGSQEMAVAHHILQVSGAHPLRQGRSPLGGPGFIHLRQRIPPWP